MGGDGRWIIVELASILSVTSGTIETDGGGKTEMGRKEKWKADLRNRSIGERQFGSELFRYPGSGGVVGGVG